VSFIYAILHVPNSQTLIISSVLFNLKFFVQTVIGTKFGVFSNMGFLVVSSNWHFEIFFNETLLWTGIM